MSIYKAYNRTQAIDIACAIIGSEMIGKNDEMTKNFDGMPVYTFEDGSYFVDASEKSFRHLHVCERESGDMSVEDYHDIVIGTDGKIESYAEYQSQIIYRRIHIDKCGGIVVSEDVPYMALEEPDRFVIKTLIIGAIKALQNGYNQAADVAEYQAMEYFRGREINTYLTVYNPIANNPFTR